MTNFIKLDKRLMLLSPDILLLIGQIDELKGRWIAGVKLHPQTLKNLKESTLITSTGSSTRIEGSKLSDEDVEKLMRGISMQKFADRDRAEVRGYFELLDNVFNAWESVEINESTIKSFHKELLKHVEKDKIHRGEYKKSENKVHMVDKSGNSIGILFDTTPAYLTPIAMRDLVNWVKVSLLQKKYHPLLVIGNFLVDFLQIHPFTDGNGRLSRVLTNLLLLKHGYAYTPYVSHEKIIEDNKADYYLALRSSQKTFGKKQESIDTWLKFFLGVVLKQSKIAIDLFSEENLTKTFSPKQILVWEYLRKVGEATPLDMSRETGVARPTINQIVQKLLKLKKVEKIGLGRSTRYRVI